jgi:hypothetical protein
MVTDYEVGALDRRLELAVNAAIDEAIDALALELAGGDPRKVRKGFRSKAARKLLAEGAEARARKLQASRAAKAGVAAKKAAKG